MGRPQTMALQLELSTVLPRIGMESYGPPLRLACGGLITWAGSLSELSGTLRPGPFGKLDLIQTGYCGCWLGILAPQWISSTFCQGPDTSKQQKEICQSRGSCWTRIEPS